MNEKVVEASPTLDGGRKQITAVFIDVVGFSEIATRLDAEDLQNWLEDFYVQAREIIEAYEGEVTEYLGDGIVALFGLTNADELSASRAVHASLAAVDQIDAGKNRGIKISLRIGVATGEVVVRSETSDKNMPRATGIVTTLAKRIQEKAKPGTVLIAQTTQDLLRGMLNTKKLAPQELRGFEEAQALFQPLLRPSSKLLEGPRIFVSRDKELQEIAKSAAPCLVTGPPGIGKTALLLQFTNPLGKTTLFTADGAQSHSIYLPFIRWIIDQVGSDTPQYRHLQLHFGKLSEQRRRAVALILGLPEGQPLLTELSGVALKTLIEESIWWAIQSRQPDGVIIFDDLHWLDSASWGVLVHILKSKDAARYRILLASRPDPKIATYFDGIDLTEIPLEPLTASEAKVLLKALSEDDRSENPALVERAAGIPLFLEQLSKRKAEKTLPDTLTDLLAEQIDATGPAKSLLQSAAIIGQSFDQDMLTAIADTHQSITPQLEAAEAMGVLRNDGDGQWSFAHALLRQAAYDSMLRGTRIRYHNQAAAWLQTKRASEIRTNPSRVAEHLRQSEQYVPAIQSYLALSQDALFRGAFDDAEAHVLMAIKLCEDATPDIDVRALEMWCYTALGSIRMQTLGFTAHPVRAAFDAVLELAHGQNTYTMAHGPAFYGSFTNAILSADKTRAAQFSNLLREAANQVTEDPNKELTVASLNVDASLHLYNGDFIQSFKNCDSLRDTYNFAKHSTMIANYGVDSFAATQMFEAAGRAIYGDTQLIDALSTETDDHQTLMNIPVMLPYAQIWGAVPLYYAGQTSRAIARVRKGLQLAEEQSAAFWQITGTAWLHVMHPRESDSSDGLAKFKDVITTHEAVGANIGLPYFRAHYALALAKHGRLDEAYSSSLEAVRENTSNGFLCWYAEVLRIHAGLCHKTDRNKKARRFFDHAVQTAQAQSARLWLLRARLDQAKLGLIEGKDLAAAIDAFDPVAQPPEIANAKAWLATA